MATPEDPSHSPPSIFISLQVKLTVAFVVVSLIGIVVAGADAAGAASFLGPLVDEILTLADPDRSVARSMGLSSLPAFVAIRQDGSVIGVAASLEASEASPAICPITVRSPVPITIPRPDPATMMVV